MPWYRTGSVAITAGQNTVTGTGTNFSTNARVGDAFQGPDSRWYEVTNIASATVLSIMPAYQGATVSAGAYGLAPMQGYVKESADRLRQLVDQWGSTLAGLGTVSTENVVPVAKGGTGGTTPEQARNGLGLGSAALANTTASATDSTAGRLLKVGDFGWGGAAILLTNVTAPALLDSNTVPSGKYHLQLPGVTWRGLPAGEYAIEVTRLGASGGCIQRALHYSTGENYERRIVSKDFVSIDPIGVRQKWSNVSSQRALGTNYTNNTGRPIQIAVQAGPTSAVNTNLRITVDGVSVFTAYAGSAGEYIGSANAIIPPGAVYQVAAALGTAALTNWSELN